MGELENVRLENVTIRRKKHVPAVNTARTRAVQTPQSEWGKQSLTLSVFLRGYENRLQGEFTHRA